jgi:hypothetical protein
VGIGSCARPATCVAVRSSAVQSVAQPSVRARTFLTRDSVSATRTATSFAGDCAIPIGRDAGGLGRDACGNSLAGSLTVFRHRPGHRAEPDPNRPYQAPLICGLSGPYLCHASVRPARGCRGGVGGSIPWREGDPVDRCQALCSSRHISQSQRDHDIAGKPAPDGAWVGTPAAAPSSARSPSSGIGLVTERSPTRIDPTRRRLSAAYLRPVVAVLGHARRPLFSINRQSLPYRSQDLLARY